MQKHVSRPNPPQCWCGLIRGGSPQLQALNFALALMLGCVNLAERVILV